MSGESALSLVGTTIAGKYRVLSKISEGGMGQVYLAEHIDLKDLRAIKIVSLETGFSDILKQRFLNEIKVTHRVCQHNPHIVQIYDTFGFEKSYGYYVMEYLEGDLLTHRIIDHPGTLPISWCIQIAMDVCSAMSTAHSEGIVHRDLKPDNIFLVNAKGRSDFVKIVDFGIAQLETSDHRLTKTGAIIGTILYLSPEQIVTNSAGKEQKPITHRSDIYALGCILFEMLIGKAPFEPDGPMSPLVINELLMSHLMQPPPSLRELRPEIPTSLEDIVHRAMAKRPDERFSSMDEFSTTLEYVLHNPTAEFVPLLSFHEDDDDDFTKVDEMVATQRNSPPVVVPMQRDEPEVDTDETEYDDDSFDDKATMQDDPISETMRALATRLAEEEAAEAMAEASPAPAIAPMSLPLPTSEREVPDDEPLEKRWWILSTGFLLVGILLAVFLPQYLTKGKQPVVGRKAPGVPAFLRNLKAQYAAGEKLYSKALATGNDALFLRAATRWKLMIQTQGFKRSPYYPNLYLGIGRAFLKAKHLRLSRNYYRRFVKASPANDETAVALKKGTIPGIQVTIKARRKQSVQFNRALEQELSRGQFRMALKTYTEALKAAPSLPLVHLKLAKIIAPLFPHVARQAVDNVLQRLEPNAKMQQDLRQFLASLGRFSQKREKDFQRAQADVQAMLARAAYRAARQRIVRALSNWRRWGSLAAHQRMTAWLQKLSATAPKQAIPVLRAYQKTIQQLQAKGLLPWLEKGTVPLPKPSSFPQRISVLKQLEAWRKSHRRLQSALARGQWQRALQLSRRNASIWRALQAQDRWSYTTTYLARGQKSLAYQKAIKQALYSRARGLAHLEKARFWSASKALERTLSLLKSTPAYALVRRQYSAAKRKIQRGRSALAKGKAAYQRGQAYNRKRDWTVARKQLGVYMKLFPKAWDLKIIKFQHNSASCALNIPWAFCDKRSRRRPK